MKKRPLNRAKIAGIAAAAVLITLAGVTLKLLRDAGVFFQVPEATLGGRCTPLAVTGAEDITFQPQAQVAYISALDRYAANRSGEVQGKLFQYSVARSSLHELPIPAPLRGDFKPHGLSFYHDATQGDLLFVVNHSRHGDRVEKLQLHASGPRWLKSFTHPLFHDLNDVVALDADRFYVSVDHGFRGPFWQRLENYLRWPGGAVLFAAAGHVRRVAGAIPYANGVNIDRLRQRLLVASLTGRQVRMYGIDGRNGALREQRIIDMPGGPDNIEIDAQGALWVAVHTKLLRLALHSKHPGTQSPTYIQKITLLNHGERRRLVYAGDGRVLSAGSVAAFHDGVLLIGAIFADRFLVCRGVAMEDAGAAG